MSEGKSATSRMIQRLPSLSGGAPWGRTEAQATHEGKLHSPGQREDVRRRDAPESTGPGTLLPGSLSGDVFKPFLSTPAECGFSFTGRPDRGPASGQEPGSLRRVKKALSPGRRPAGSGGRAAKPGLRPWAPTLPGCRGSRPGMLLSDQLSEHACFRGFLLSVLRKAASRAKAPP